LNIVQLKLHDQQNKKSAVEKTEVQTDVVTAEKGKATIQINEQ